MNNEDKIRMAVASAVANVLNYPEGVGHHLLGQNLSKVIDAATQSVIGTGLVELDNAMMKRPEVTRVELIGGHGRAYVKYGASGVSTSLQDEGRTLKLFVDGGIDGL